MNDVKVTRVFREAWIFVTEYYFVWLKGLLQCWAGFFFRWFRVGLTGPF